MRINHNTSGLNSLNKNYQNISKVNSSLKKLSSGLRINQAADDSAGLAISEKMRAQIRGLEQAEKNVRDGISLVDTADAGLGQIADPNLIRLRELAVQAANDTLSSKDRQIIQQEVNQIIKGIDDIANDTEFNTINLLNGTNSNSVSSIGGNTSFNYENVLRTPPVDSNGAFLFGTNEGYPTTSEDNNQTLVYDRTETSEPSVRIDGESYKLRNNNEVSITPTVEIDGTYQTVYTIPEKNVQVSQLVTVVEDKYEIKYSITNNGTDNRAIGFQYHLDTMLGTDDFAPFIVDGTPVDTQTVYEGSNIPDDFTVYNQNTGEGANAEFQGQGIIKGPGIIEEPSKFAIGEYNKISEWDFDSNNGSVGDSGYSVWWNPRLIGTGDSFSVNTFYGQSIPPTIDDPTAKTDEGPYDLILQTGANSLDHFKIQLSDVRTTKLGIDNLDVLSQHSADNAIDKIDKAAELVISERTKYGSYQNVLEHINNNVSNYKSNLTAAESQLRDLDTSKEIAKLANHQVLLQASQSMIARSNQISQSILEFLE